MGRYPSECLLLSDAYGEGLTSLTTTRFNNLLSTGSGATATKSVLIQTFAIAWLKGAFHAFLRNSAGIVRLRSDPGWCSINGLMSVPNRRLLNHGKCKDVKA